MKNLFAMVFVFAGFITDMQAQFQIDGQFRIRPQLLHGYKKPVAKETDPAFHVGQRTRLNLRYANEQIKTLISIQDIRVWGDEDLVNATGVTGKSYRNLDIYEAWIQVKTGRKSFLKIGRQEMKYDDQRHISWRNWWDSGLTYDAVLFNYNNKESGWQLDLSGSYNSKALDLTGNNYSDGTEYFGNINPILTHNFIYLKRTFNPKIYVSLTGIGAGYQKEGTANVIYMTLTEGLHLNYNMTKKSTDGLFAKANAFLQNGKNIKGKKINAHMITGLLGYRTMDKKLEVKAGIELLSGNDNYQTDAEYWETDRTYNLLYGGRHPYYEGYMDWFVTPKSTLSGGLQTISIGLQYKLSEKCKLLLAYNNVAAANNILKVNSSGDEIRVDKGSNLAQTFDLMHIKKINKSIMLHTGISYGLPSDDFNTLKGISDPGNNYFAYMMLTVKPVFFKSQSK